MRKTISPTSPSYKLCEEKSFTSGGKAAGHCIDLGRNGKQLYHRSGLKSSRPLR